MVQPCTFQTESCCSYVMFYSLKIYYSVNILNRLICNFYENPFDCRQLISFELILMNYYLKEDIQIHILVFLTNGLITFVYACILVLITILFGLVAITILHPTLSV